MLAVDFLIERLQEQAELAPTLEESILPGGSLDAIQDRLKAGMNLAYEIPVLRTVESGARRYAKHFGDALGHVEKLRPLFDKASTVKNAAYPDQLTRDKAMQQFKDTPKKIADLCNAAIAELRKAGKVLEEGEARETMRSVGAGK